MSAETVAPSALPRRNVDALGEILWLLANSALHRAWRLSDIERFILPALRTSRYKLYKSNGRPVGYVSIALLSKATERRWLAGGYQLQPEDWISGDRPWIMALVAPFGNFDAIREKVAYEPELTGRLIKAFRPNKDGKGVRTVTYAAYQIRRMAPRTAGQSGRAPSRAASARSGTDAGSDQAPGDMTTSVTTPLPHVDEVLWLNPDNWMARCCLPKYRADD